MSPTEKILRDFDKLPDSAVVPTKVAALHDHVSERTVRRNYPLIRLPNAAMALLSGICGIARQRLARHDRAKGKTGRP